MDGTGSRRLGRGAASEPRLPRPRSPHVWVRSEAGSAAPNGSEGKQQGRPRGVPEFAVPTRGPQPPSGSPGPHATGAGSRAHPPSTYLTGRASPGTKVSWEQSRALTSMPPSGAEGATPGALSEST